MMYHRSSSPLVQQDEEETKEVKAKKIDPLLEVYQQRRVHNLKQKAQAAVPLRIAYSIALKKSELIYFLSWRVGKLC